MERQQFNELLTKYADLVVRIGANVQPGQRVSLDTGIDDAALAREIARAAYRAGAYYVDPVWRDERMARIRLEQAPGESLDLVPDWQLAAFMEFTGDTDASISLYSADPELLAGIDPERVDAWMKPRRKKFKPLYDRIESNAFAWTLVSTASPVWAHKVFPALPVEQAQVRLWEAIFQVCRVDQPDPVQAWKDHLADLALRREYLDSKRYSALHLRGPGTDLTIGLPLGHKWIGGGGSCKAPSGLEFVPNMPTDEVFTLPHRERVDGYVSATLPLSIRGNMIEDFQFTFERGCVVKATARKGEEHLLRELRTDQGASRIGEIALVTDSSPVSSTKLLFYNALYDENAACHIALGAGYRFCVDGGAAMSEAEFEAAGGNNSLIHDDFMVGSNRMDIDGIGSDGLPKPILRSGEWAFEA